MLICSSIFEHETAASMTTNPETLRCTSCVPTHIHTHFRAVSWRKPKRVFYIRFTGKFDSFQQSLCRTLQANLHSDDISMCFKYCSNVGPFHLTRDCRPVCVWLTCPMPPLYAAVCFCWLSFEFTVTECAGEYFFKLSSPRVLSRVAFNLFSWPAHPAQKRYHRTCGNLKFLSKACVYTRNQSLTPLNLYSYLNYLRFKLCT